MLTLQRFAPSHLDGLTELVNRHLRLLTVSWLTTPDELSACLWGSRWPHAEFWDSIADLEVHCAVERERVVGAVQFGLFAPSGPNSARHGIVNWLYFDPEHVAAGEELLRRVFGIFEEKGCRSAEAFPQCGGLRFVNFARGYLSAQWKHIDQALLTAGFERIERSVNLLMTAELAALKEMGEPEAKVSLAWHFGSEWEVVARDVQSGRRAAFCAAWDMARASDDPAAEEWLFLAYVETEQEYRHRGLGTYLLAQLMQCGVQRNKRHLALTVIPQNIGAVQLYRKLGLQKRDEMWSYETVWNRPY